MKRTTALLLVGVLCLVAAIVAPILGLVTAQWDTTYVYSVETGNSYCADVVHETPAAEGTPDHRVAYENLSETGRRHVDRALRDGRYVVENESDLAPDFQFTSDHVAPGEGCYAIRHDGETHALRTSTDSQRVGPVGGRLPSLLADLFLVVGTASVLAGGGLLLRRRFE